MIAAPGMAIRAAGKTVAGFEKSNPAGIEGQSPVTVRPRRNQMTKATTTAEHHVAGDGSSAPHQGDDEDHDRPHHRDVGEDPPDPVERIRQRGQQCGQFDGIPRLRLGGDADDEQPEHRQAEQDDIGRPTGPGLSLVVREQTDAPRQEFDSACVSRHVCSFPSQPGADVDVAAWSRLRSPASDLGVGSGGFGRQRFGMRITSTGTWARSVIASVTDGEIIFENQLRSWSPTTITSTAYSSAACRIASGSRPISPTVIASSRWASAAAARAVPVARSASDCRVSPVAVLVAQVDRRNHGRHADADGRRGDHHRVAAHVDQHVFGVVPEQACGCC